MGTKCLPPETRLILTEGQNAGAENGELLIPGLTRAKSASVGAAGR